MIPPGAGHGNERAGRVVGWDAVHNSRAPTFNATDEQRVLAAPGDELVGR
jgi:hypothetical protein